MQEISTKSTYSNTSGGKLCTKIYIFLVYRSGYCRETNKYGKMPGSNGEW